MGDESRLTRRQLLLWRAPSRASGAPSYNLVAEVDIAGALDPERFRSAFTAVVGAADAFHSVFHEVNGEPRREVKRATSPFDLRYVDLSGQPSPETGARRMLDELARQDFDLGVRGFDSVLLRLAHDRFVWSLCVHRLIADETSIALLYAALAARYGKTPHPELGSADAAALQERTYLASSQQKEDEAFWAGRRTRDFERFSFYEPSPASIAHPEHQVERLTQVLDAGASQRLRAQAARYASPAFPELGERTLLATVLFAFLHRISANDDPVVGMPLGNRHGEAAASALGCFFEVPPVQADVRAGDTFETLARRLAGELTAVLRHGQHCVADSGEPGFDVTFSFHAERFPPFAGFPTVVALRGWGVEAFGLHAHDFGGQGRYTLGFDFQTAAFDAAQRRQAVDHFMRLLGAALADLDTPIDGVSLLSPEERAAAITPVPTTPFRSVVRQFEAQAACAGDAQALHFHQQTLTYAQLDARATRLAHVLRERGVGKDVLVGILLERSADLPAVLLATMKAGGAYVPLDPGHPPMRLALILETTRPAIVLTQRSLRTLVQAPATSQVLCLEDVALDGESPGPLPEPAPDDLAYVICTSGSTGRPKGVAIPHGALASFLGAMGQRLGFTSAERVLALTTIGFDISILELFLPLVTGASVELVDVATSSDPVRLSAAIAERRPTILQATPATWQMLLETGWPGDRSIRALCGGEALAPELAPRLVDRVGELLNVYGPTETTVWASIDRVDPARPRDVTIGRPLANTTMYVVNAAMQLAPVGVRGEICIGGEGLARGYYGDAALTATRFLPDPFREGGRLYRTGDLGVRRADGRIECLGRSDFQVKIRGFRIELGEIESALLSHPGVAAAVVVASDERPGRRFLAGYVVPRAGASLDLLQVRRHVEGRLPSYMVPATLMALEALPLTPSGKVDRKALPAATPMSATNQHEPPQSDLELRVTAIFEKLLGVRPGRQDNFFDLGGDSLLAVELTTALGRLSKGSLGIGTIFEHPTVAALASIIDREGPAPSPPVIPLNSAREGVPLFCICGVNVYRELARTLGDREPIFGVYLPAEEEAIARAQTDGPDFSVERLAREYVAAIRNVRPRGPYRLAGFSFGGILAYEMAQQLTRAGEQVSFLGLLDTVLPRAIARRWRRWGKAHLTALMGPSGVEHLRSSARRLLRAIERRSRGLGATYEPAGMPAGMERRIGAYDEATRRYDRQIRPYPGSALLFRASQDELPGYEVDPHFGWRALVDALEVRDVEGAHLSILEAPHVGTIASSIRQSLDA